MTDDCRSCHYSKTDRGLLICRRYPPAERAGFPSVNPGMWCGEFRPMRPLGRDPTPAVVTGPIPRPTLSHGRVRPLVIAPTTKTEDRSDDR